MHVLLNVNNRSKVAKFFLEFAKTLPFVSIEVEEKQKHYDPAFVSMVEKAASSKKRKKVDNIDELWEAL